MKKIFLMFVCFGTFHTLIAQDKKVQQSETIIIEDDKKIKSGNTTIEIKDGEVFIDGKKVDQTDKGANGEVKIIRKKYLNGKEVPVDDDDIFSSPFEGLDAVNQRPMLGVTFKNTDHNEGAEVEKVIPKSPAEKMGIQPGDIITKIDDKNISNPKDLVDAIGSYKPGDMVDVTFERAHKMMTKKATLDKQNENFTFNRSMPFGEDIFRDMNPFFRQFNDDNFSTLPRQAPSPKIGLSVEDRADGEGVLVQEVTENSAASKGGIQKGDVITVYSGEEISNVDELMDAIQKHQTKAKVEVELKRNGLSKKMEISVPKNLKKREL